MSAGDDDDEWVGQVELDIIMADWGNGVRYYVYPTGGDGISMNVVNVDNSSVAELAGYVTQDLVVETSGDWLSAQLIVSLDEGGGVYQDPLGNTGWWSPNPAFFDAFPSYEFDTYVSSGWLGEVVSATGAVDLGGLVNVIFDESEISIAWYTTDTYGPGELALARVTLADDATGSWSFLATAAPAEGPLLRVGGRVIGGALLFHGDLNSDGFVGQGDLDIVLAMWGAGGEDITDPRADVNGDGWVGQADLDYVLISWGWGPGAPGPAAPVPDPAALSLLAVAWLATLRRRRLRAH
jgi:hypothetical protein